MLKESLKVKTDAKADSSQIYIKDDMRVTYLTSRLIRVETADIILTIKKKNLILCCTRTVEKQNIFQDKKICGEHADHLTGLSEERFLIKDL